MPDILTLTKIANALSISVDTLLGIDKPPDNLSSPQTLEARILAAGIDKLPKEQREQALNVVKAMFLQYSDVFERNDNDDSEL